MGHRTYLMMYDGIEEELSKAELEVFKAEHQDCFNCEASNVKRWRSARGLPVCIECYLNFETY
jgi:ribosomal protein L37AE/L43A